MYISWRKPHHFPLEYHNIFIYIQIEKDFLKSDRRRESDWQYKLAFSPGSSHNMQLNFFSIFSGNKSQSIKKEKLEFHPRPPPPLITSKGGRMGPVKFYFVHMLTCFSQLLAWSFWNLILILLTSYLYLIPIILSLYELSRLDTIGYWYPSSSDQTFFYFAILINDDIYYDWYQFWYARFHTMLSDEVRQRKKQC